MESDSLRLVEIVIKMKTELDSLKIQNTKLQNQIDNMELLVLKHIEYINGEHCVK